MPLSKPTIASRTGTLTKNRDAFFFRTLTMLPLPSSAFEIQLSLYKPQICSKSTDVSESFISVTVEDICENVDVPIYVITVHFAKHLHHLHAQRCTNSDKQIEAADMSS